MAVLEWNGWEKISVVRTGVAAEEGTGMDWTGADWNGVAAVEWRGEDWSGWEGKGRFGLQMIVR